MLAGNKAFSEGFGWANFELLPDNIFAAGDDSNNQRRASKGISFSIRFLGGYSARKMAEDCGVCCFAGPLLGRSRFQERFHEVRVQLHAIRDPALVVAQSLSPVADAPQFSVQM